MKMFLSGLTEPVVTVCYIANEQGNPVEIDYNQLKKNANGSDPFAVPANADPATNHDLLNLRGARFMMGFRAQIGLPPGIPPLQMPDIVTLGSDTAKVTYNLLCSQFTVVQLDPGSGYSPASWMNESQPRGLPWIFTSTVDLRLSTASPTAYSKLPPAVQDQIRNLGSAAFSVQQLLFDLDNAGLETIPKITGVEPGTKLYMVLEQSFLGAYFTKMKQNGTPVLCHAITQIHAPISSLTLTNLNMEVSPFLGNNGQPIINPTPTQQDLATLSYLCAAGGDPLPPAAPFGWNWIEQPEETDYHGVVAINRNAFANYLRHQLADYVRSNCYLPYVRVTYDAGKVETDYSWNLTPYQDPAVNMPATGAMVLSFHHDADASDQAGLNGDMGRMDLHPSFDLNVSFSGNTITVRQHLVIYLYIRSLASAAEGNVVDVTITDTYTIAVTQDGRLAATRATDRQDHSKHPSVNPFLNFWTGVNDLIKAVDSWLQNVTATNFQDLPVSVVQDFVFPGGGTFAYKSVAFSDNQDLVSHITYTDPSS